MTDVHEIDAVIQLVRQAADRFHFRPNAAMTQQILLLGDSFYGYRFVTPEFTSIWSATEQTLKMFDGNGLKLGVLRLNELAETPNLIKFNEPVPSRKAA